MVMCRERRGHASVSVCRKVIRARIAPSKKIPGIQVDMWHLTAVRSLPVHEGEHLACEIVQFDQPLAAEVPSSNPQREAQVIGRTSHPRATARAPEWTPGTKPAATRAEILGPSAGATGQANRALLGRLPAGEPLGAAAKEAVAGRPAPASIPWRALLGLPLQAAEPVSIHSGVIWYPDI